MTKADTTPQNATNQTIEEAVDRGDFLTAMRAVANSVTVVTTDGKAGRHGGTVSAFCSVSADPPTVLVCLHGDSRIAETVAENGSFCVNVLTTSNQHCSDRFAGRHDNEVEDRFTDIALEESSDITAPIIEGSTAFCCDIKETVTSGTHRIFIGRVMSVKAGKPDPLLYFDGAYRQMGDKL
jgi:flavin reductase (DIM6/NTAB) family NADH-FMN oxidoreductase RutF